VFVKQACQLAVVNIADVCSDINSVHGNIVVVKKFISLFSRFTVMR
jgi:hypothetical protein